MAWGAAQVTSQYTGELLFGTTGGKIYQAAIEASDKGIVDRFVGGKEQRDVKQLYDLGDRHALTGVYLVPFLIDKIDHRSGLHVERFPAARGDTKFVVMATTPTRIYQFIGGPTFEALFASYATSPSFQEVHVIHCASNSGSSSLFRCLATPHALNCIFIRRLAACRRHLRG